MRSLEDRVEALAWRLYENSLRDPAVGVDDLKQYGRMSVLSAKKHFDKNRGMTFESYALLCARTTMIDVIRKSRYVYFSGSPNIEPTTKPRDGFMLMLSQLQRSALSPRARKLLDGALEIVWNLSECSLLELRRQLGMTPREFGLARLELIEKLNAQCCLSV